MKRWRIDLQVDGLRSRWLTLQILYEGRTAETALKDKHGFDTKFEDLFRAERRGAPGHQEKYGATGDIMRPKTYRRHRQDSSITTSTVSCRITSGPNRVSLEVGGD